MKKLISITSLLLFILLNTSYSNNIPNLSYETLISNNWFWYENGFENDWIVQIKFNKNNTFKTPGQYGEELTIIEGTYKLLNNIIELEYYNYSGHQPASPPEGYRGKLIKTKCKYVDLKESIIYKSCIECDNNKLLSRSDLYLNEGEIRVIDNVKVVTTGYKLAMAIENVKIREKPTIESKSYKYQDGLYDYPPKEYVPKDSRFILLARTVNKYKINNWENYWYYVNIGGMYNQKGWVWMYGEFIKVLKN